MDVAQVKADVELCCPALSLNLRWHIQTCESQKPALLCPAWAALPASQCAPYLTLTSGCDTDLLGVGNCPQKRCNFNHTVSWSNSVSTSLCNRLYAYSHVHHWCGSKDPSTVQLLIDTTVLQ